MRRVSGRGVVSSAVCWRFPGVDAGVHREEGAAGDCVHGSTVRSSSEKFAFRGALRRFGVALRHSLAPPCAVLERLPHPEDFLLAQKCLEGDERAIAEFQERHGQLVQAYLVKRGAAPEEAKEIVASLWADCLVGTNERRPRIAGYIGASSLQTWLNVVAMNFFLSARRHQARTNKLMPLRVHDTESAEGEQQSGAESPLTMADERQQPTEEPVIAMLRQAIEQAFARCTPEDFVLLQLSHSDGIRQQELARIWGCDAATISRKLKRAGAEVATRILEHVQESDPYLDLEWSDFTELCRVANLACFGRVE
jgi:RNA polymerase sigma-70 factor